MNGAAHNMFGSIFERSHEATIDAGISSRLVAVMHPAILARLRRLDDEGVYVMRHRDGFALGAVPIETDVDHPANRITFCVGARGLQHIFLAEVNESHADAAALK